MTSDRLRASDALGVAERALASARGFIDHEAGCDCSVCWRVAVVEDNLAEAIAEAELLDDDGPDDAA